MILYKEDMKIKLNDIGIMATDSYGNRHKELGKYHCSIVTDTIPHLANFTTQENAKLSTSYYGHIITFLTPAL